MLSRLSRRCAISAGLVGVCASGRCPVSMSPEEERLYASGVYHLPSQEPSQREDLWPFPSAVPDLWKGHYDARCEVITTAREMNSSGINQGTSGNVSVRVDGGFLVTPSGVPYDTMRPQDVVFVDLAEESGYYGEMLPSSEWRMHRDMYLQFPDALAVVHTHSTFATALSAHRRPIPAFHYMVGIAGGKQIPCAEYATFGSQELSNNICGVLGTNKVKACLLANHGVLCYSSSLPKALHLAAEVEILAKQYNLSSAFGEPTLLSDAEMDVILAKFKTYGKQPEDLAGMCCFDQEHAVAHAS